MKPPIENKIYPLLNWGPNRCTCQCRASLSQAMAKAKEKEGDGEPKGPPKDLGCVEAHNQW